MSDRIRTHLSAEQVQAFLDGEMSRKERRLAEVHLGSCARCAAEVESWTALFEDLGQLRLHRPHEGFADRVLINVTVPQAPPLAARLRARAEALFGARSDGHLSGELLQDFLEGELAARRAHTVERHLRECHACAKEADAWLAVMQRLGSLEALAPSRGFADEVLRHVRVPVRPPLAARIRSALAAFVASPSPTETNGHVPAGILQDLVDGALPKAAVARVTAHVDDCARCTRELEAWRTVSTRLGSLGHVDPTDGFADRVLHGVRAARAGAVATRPVRTPLLAAARARLRRFLPETRQAVAALSGAAVTPTVVVGLAFWAIFTHPTVTLGSLISFAWWQVTDLAGAAMGAMSAGAAQSAELFGLYSLMETLASAPGMVAAGVLAYTAFCALALRVLYKNLFANRPYAHVSTAS